MMHLHDHGFITFWTRPWVKGREPMAREPDVVLLMTAADSLDIFLTQ